MQSATPVAPGWYPPDPVNQMVVRWWNGAQWSQDCMSWDSVASRWVNVPPSPAAPDSIRPAARTLLQMNAVRKGGGVAHVLVTTESLQIDATGGLSTWKALLGMGTLGISYAATGIASVHGGNVEVPLRVVSAAYVSNSRFPWADLMLIVAGETIPTHMAWASALVAADAIKAALAGGPQADLFADAWEASRQPRPEPWKSLNRRLQADLRSGVLSQHEFERISHRFKLEESLRAYR